MLRKAFLFLLCLIPFLTMAQYELIKKDVHNQYKDELGYYLSVKSDSVTVNGQDSTFLLSRSHYYYFPFLADKILKKNDEYFVYTYTYNNYSGIIFKIIPNKKPGDSWIFFEKNDSTQYYATVDSVGFREIYPGVSDSVKYISISPGQIGETYKWQLEISRSFGIVKYFNFFQFPSAQKSKTFFMSQSYRTLSGSSLIPNSLKKIDAISFNDFSIGDEFHIVNTGSCMLSRCGPFVMIDSTKYLVLSKSFSADSSVLAYSIRKTAREYSSYGYYPKDRKDELIDTIINVTFTRNDPRFAFEYSGNPSGWYFNPTGETYSKFDMDLIAGKDVIVNYGMQMGSQDIFTEEFYIKGLFGGPFYEIRSTSIGLMNSGGELTNKMVYYKTASGTRGTPLPEVFKIAGVSKPSSENTIKIYPNPSDDIITIETEASLGFTGCDVFSVTGSMVKSIEQSQSNVYTISKNELGTGMFLVKFRSTDNVETRRITIK